MTDEQQLKLQAFLDAELNESEARAVAAWIARDPEATALLNELRNTRRALANFEPEYKLPESREFFWSKLERDIRPLQSVPEQPETGSVFTLLRRLMLPAGGLAAVALAMIIGGTELGLWGTVARKSDTEMTVADSGAFTYQDDANGTTLVWVSYPAESGFANHGAR